MLQTPHQKSAQPGHVHIRSSLPAVFPVVPAAMRTDQDSSRMQEGADSVVGGEICAGAVRARVHLQGRPVEGRGDTEGLCRGLGSTRL